MPNDEKYLRLKFSTDDNITKEWHYFNNLNVRLQNFDKVTENEIIKFSNYDGETLIDNVV